MTEPKNRSYSKPGSKLLAEGPLPSRGQSLSSR